MIFKDYSNIFNTLDDKERENLTLEINSILEDAWGKFPDHFVKNHILKSEKVVFARNSDQCLAFCCVNTKNILGKKVFYIEFLVVRKKFQDQNIGSLLLHSVIKKQILKNIVKIWFYPFEIMFISPNIRVITWIAKFAKFIYPNPYLSDEEGRILLADDVTWRMAQDLIRRSDMPNRKISREGLVLEGSYEYTPWLVYDTNSIPWSRTKSKRIYKFTERYLDYAGREGKEFIVRVQLNFFSILKYLARSII